MKISFIATVFNEEKNISKLLDSLLAQSRTPDEIVIVDGGSTDKTIEIIKNYESRFKKSNSTFRFIIKKGNRSVGRNEAIRQSSWGIIVCSDAGCVLDKDWVKNILKPFKNQQVDVIAGYYKGIVKTVFQKCLVPYVLVMPDNVNPENFLPATRSLAFRKSIWKKNGGFPEQLSNNEDYVFARNLKKIKATMVFEKSAIAYWIPRKNLREAFVMFFRFALGDADAGIFRLKVVLIFVRYLIGVLFLIWNIKVLLLSLIIYLAWSITKNYKYVRELNAIFLLPILQVSADLAVMAGTAIGFKIWVIKKM